MFSSGRALQFIPEWETNADTLSSATPLQTRLKRQIYEGHDGQTDRHATVKVAEETLATLPVICSVWPVLWFPSYAALVIQTVMTVNRNSTDRDSLSIISVSQPGPRPSWQCIVTSVIQNWIYVLTSKAWCPCFRLNQDDVTCSKNLHFDRLLHNCKMKGNSFFLPATIFIWHTKK